MFFSVTFYQFNLFLLYTNIIIVKKNLTDPKLSNDNVTEWETKQSILNTINIWEHRAEA